jgi:hypothetical protein
MNDDKLTLEDIVENIPEDEIRQVRTFERALANLEILELISSEWSFGHTWQRSFSTRSVR